MWKSSINKNINRDDEQDIFIQIDGGDDDDSIYATAIAAAV